MKKILLIEDDRDLNTGLTCDLNWKITGSVLHLHWERAWRFLHGKKWI